MYAGYRLEENLRKNGFLLVCGIDEVGRGSFAGPLVVASVILPRNCQLTLKDSKLLGFRDRVELASQIKNDSIGYGLGWVSSEEIDYMGLTVATALGCKRSLSDMDSDFSRVIIDGNIDYLKDYEVATAITRADSSVACVAAASIIAKVARDDFMMKISKDYPEYGFEKNVGYGTSQHRDAIKKYGLTKFHRNLFCRGYIGEH